MLVWNGYLYNKVDDKSLKVLWAILGQKYVKNTPIVEKYNSKKQTMLVQN